LSARLIEEYVAGLRRRLPAGLAEEAAGGLLEAYERGLERGAGEQLAAREAIAAFGDLELVVGEFTRQSPGRRVARLLLATGPVAGLCWAGALIAGRAWAWPVPGAVRLGFGAALLLAVLALLAAATSSRGYRRTRLTTLACPVILALDAGAVAAVAAITPALTWPLGAAVTVSLARITFTARTLPWLTAR
jgi:hypothetical protein